MSKGWRFTEPPETDVYTTRQVFVDGAVLGVVSHDPNGDWQFLHDEEEDEAGDLRNEDDLLVVSLQEIVDRFPEVRELADLPTGWFAFRADASAAWAREPQPPEWAGD